MRVDSRDLSLATVFAALYAVLVVALKPISFDPIQLRVADALIPFAALFGWPVVIGVTVGCFVGNVFGGLGPIDVVFGSIANLIAASVVLLLRRHRLSACIVGALPIGMIVGGYLWTFPFLPRPDIFGLALPAWAAMIISVTLSSLVAMAIIGYGLLTLFSRPSIIEPLKSRGLKVIE